MILLTGKLFALYYKGKQIFFETAHGASQVTSQRNYV